METVSGSPLLLLAARTYTSTMEGRNGIYVADNNDDAANVSRRPVYLSRTRSVRPASTSLSPTTGSQHSMKPPLVDPLRRPRTDRRQRKSQIV